METELSEKEKIAVETFIAAARALPRSICVETTQLPDDRCSAHIRIWKREGLHSAVLVAGVKKRSAVL